MPSIMAFPVFLYAAILLTILYAGAKVAKYADVIAEKSNFSSSWAGNVILSAIGSLPEIAAITISIVLLKAPDLAIGILIGGVMFNVFAIAVFDIIYNFKGRGPILKTVEPGHETAAAAIVILLNLIAAGIISSHRLPPISIFGFGTYSIGILIVFVVGSVLFFRYEHTQMKNYLANKVKKLELHEYKDNSIVDAYLKLVIFAVVAVIAASALPIVGIKIGMIMGWNDLVVGILLLGFAAALPEIINSGQALMIGAVDMAVANLFSNSLFSLALVVLADFLFFQGPILAYVSLPQAYFAIMISIMVSLAIVGLVYRTEIPGGKYIRWDAVNITIFFCITIYMLLRFSNLL